MLKLGFAVRCITPKMPCRLAGYAAMRPASGVHDDLYARALVFTGGKEPVVILQLDVLALDAICMEKFWAGLAALGLKKDNLLVCCIHTHSAFGGIFDTTSGLGKEMLPLNGELDLKLVDFLVEQGLAAIKEALRDCKETQIRLLKGALQGVATNRHSPEMPSDNGLFVMEFHRADGEKVLLYNLSSHPTVLNAKNLLISADFAGAANRYMLPQYDMVMFIQGSAGDMSTRFTRRESSFAEAERIGGIVRDKIIELVQTNTAFEPLETAELVYHTVQLREAEIGSLSDAERDLLEAKRRLEDVKTHTGDLAAIRKAESFVEGAAVNHLKAKYLAGKKATMRPVEVGILHINGKKIVCSPFELFSVLGLQLKSSYPVELFGYANNMLGYLGDTASYENMDYEALFSDFAAGEGERYIEQVAALL